MLDWHQAHDGSPVAYAHDRDHRVAQVVHYDIADGAGPGWIGYIRGRRATDRHDTADAARAAVEAAYLSTDRPHGPT
jgi:hypothetical protein